MTEVLPMRREPELRIATGLSLPINAVRDAETRLWRKVDRRGDDECWPWLASLDSSGYGQLRVAGRLHMATGLIFLLTHGERPPVVMHSCDNPPCCNPKHLLPGTKALNNADKMAKGRFRPTCGDANGSRLHPERVPRGDAHYARKEPHRMARGESHGMAKLTASDVAEIRQLFASGGRTKAAIARQFRTSQSNVGRIIHGEIWK